MQFEHLASSLWPLELLNLLFSTKQVVRAHLGEGSLKNLCGKIWIIIHSLYSAVAFVNETFFHDLMYFILLIIACVI